VIPPTPYLRWAQRHHGTAEHDLATSGIPSIAESELGPVAPLGDGAAYPALKAAIARVTGAPPREVLPALGTSQALFTAYASVLGEGDVALVEHPVYEPLAVAARAVSARVTHFERRHDRGYAVEVDAVMSRLEPRTRAVAISSLHNPSGARVPDATIAALASALAPRGVWLIVDEVYAPFDRFTSDDGVLPASARRLGPNVIAVSSLTKGFGVGLHRVGWILAPEEIVERGVDAHIATVGLLPASHAAVGVRCLERLPELAARARRLLGTKRERVAAWAQARSLEWSAPEAGLFGFARVGGSPLREVIEAGVRDHGVLAVPGEFFGAPGALRIAWSLDEAKLDPALARLERVLARV